MRAVGLRQEAYARHLPDFAAKLGTPETADRRDDVVVLLAESKLDGIPLSTMRIQTNASGPLLLESSLPLPRHYAGLRLAEATRLGISGSKEGQLAKKLMFKAYLFLCLSWGVDRMVITARHPLDRHYEALMFEDVIKEAGYVPMKHVGGMPHRVLDMDVRSVEPNWRAARHPLTRFFFDTDHPDMEITPRAMFQSSHTPVATSPVQSQESPPSPGRLTVPASPASIPMVVRADRTPEPRRLMIQPG